MIEFQQVLAMSLVGCAAIYVGWVVVARLRRREGKGCGSSCGGCGASPESTGGFVSLDSLTKPAGIRQDR